MYKAISDSNNTNYEILPNGSLLVKNASLENRGYLMCQLTDGLGNDKSQPVLLTVNGKGF